MIQITWYNLFAIIFGICFIAMIISAEKNARKRGFLPDFTSVLIIMGAIVFYAIFGGIFWW